MANHGKVANRVLREKRVSAIVPMLLGGVSRSQILHKFAELAKEDTDFALSDRSIYGYIAQAQKAIIDSSIADRETLLAIHTERLNNLYNRTYGIQDFRTSLAVQQEIAKTFGLHKERERPEDGDNRIEVTVHVVGATDAKS